MGPFLWGGGEEACLSLPRAEGVPGTGDFQLQN